MGLLPVAGVEAPLDAGAGSSATLLLEAVSYVRGSGCGLQQGQPKPMIHLLSSGATSPRSGMTPAGLGDRPQTAVPV